MRDERFELLAVEVLGAGRAVGEGGREELGVEPAEGVGRGDAGGDEAGGLFALAHERVVALESFFLGVGEANLFPVELDVPSAVGLLEKRLTELRHGGTPKSTRLMHRSRADEVREMRPLGWWNTPGVFSFFADRDRGQGTGPGLSPSKTP